jgi:hypothetical protein
MIESPLDEGVGSILIAVAVGCREVVAVADGRAVAVRVREQAVKMSSPIRRIASVVFVRNMGGNPSNFNTQMDAFCLTIFDPGTRIRLRLSGLEADAGKEKDLRNASKLQNFRSLVRNRKRYFYLRFRVIQIMTIKGRNAAEPQMGNAPGEAGVGFAGVRIAGGVSVWIARGVTVNSTTGAIVGVRDGRAVEVGV